MSIPDAHVGARNRGQLDGAGETLVTLRIIVLESDLELDGLEKVTLLLLIGVLQELVDLRPDVGYTKRNGVSVQSGFSDGVRVCVSP